MSGKCSPGEDDLKKGLVDNESTSGSSAEGASKLVDDAVEKVE